MKDLIKIVQTLLQTKGLYTGTIDGLVGSKTRVAVNNPAIKALVPNSAGWDADRMIIALAQTILKSAGFYSRPVDGYFGPVTQVSVENYAKVKWTGQPVDDKWRDRIHPQVKPHRNGWPSNNPLDINDFYGTMGKGLVSLELPYPFIYEGNMKRVDHIQCHGKVADSLERILTEVLKIYGMKEIERLKLNLWAGCIANPPRKMRGGSLWSTHSWGISMDFNSRLNQLSWKDGKASMSRPEYVPFWECWELEGWTSLGRRYNYDWMHVQALSS